MKQVISVIQLVISEFYPRLFSDNPKFFKAIQVVALIAGLIAKLPEFLQNAGIDFPQIVVAPYSTIIAVCAAIIAFVAQFPLVTPVAVVPEIVPAVG